MFKPIFCFDPSNLLSLAQPLLPLRVTTLSWQCFLSYVSAFALLFLIFKNHINIFTIIMDKRINYSGGLNPKILSEG